jgi:hypothetical protein
MVYSSRTKLRHSISSEFFVPSSTIIIILSILLRQGWNETPRHLPVSIQGM